MNKIFDIKRFGNYMLFELGRARSNYMLSAIICGMTPVIMFLFTQMFSFIVSGHAFQNLHNGYAAISAVLTILIMIITFPGKMFGEITEKRYGSDYIMRPASIFEKWAGIMLMTCVVMPLFVSAVFFLSDTLLSLCFNSVYGAPILSTVAKLKTEFMEEVQGIFSVQLGAIAYLKYVEYILIFTLGALIFKKAKAGKTILAVMIVSSVFSSVIGIGSLEFADEISTFINSFDLNDKPQAVESMFGYLNAGLNIYYAIVLSLLSWGIYYRLRTLKH